MPVYDYKCGDCGVFAALRPMSESDTPCACPACGDASRRVFIRMPGLATMDAARRVAHSTNERSRHEPKSAARTHGTNCACCKPKVGGKTAQEPNGAKFFPSARPWMISH